MAKLNRCIAYSINLQDNKSIILQYVIENIDEMISSDDPENYNKTNLIE